VSDPTIVLVHGAWCGAWVYWRLIPAIEDRGLRVVGADLPSCGAADTSVDVDDDITHVRRLIDAIDGPVVLAGKSYGGVVISAVDDPKVAHLVYVAALMPAAGEPFLGGAWRTEEFAKGVRFLEDGRTEFDVEVGVRTAFTHATPDAHDMWRRNARPMSMGTDPTKALDRVAWTTVPSTYVVCTEDRAIRPDAQMAWAKERASEVVERPFDHSPGVSDPDGVAELLREIAARY
jgi:pimeloyl-ACP methyl ester carboxylesterase